MKTKKDKLKRKRNIQLEGKGIARQLSDRATSRPRALERSGDKIDGERRWGVGLEQTVASTPTQGFYRALFERVGKLAAAQDRTPSRGEPGEPRRFNTYQRTPSPKLGGKRDMIKGNETRRERNQKRGIRNEATTERRKINRNRHRGANIQMYREIRKEPPRGDWRRMATEARQITTQPPKSAYKGYRKEQNKYAPKKITKTRAGIIRSMNRTRRIPNKDKDPDNNKMKWKYGETIKVASINVRGMRDPVKREEIITQMETNGIDTMCLQETKVQNSCYEIRKGYTFVFSSTSTDREHWGVGLCYKNYIDKI